MGRQKRELPPPRGGNKAKAKKAPPPSSEQKKKTTKTTAEGARRGTSPAAAAGTPPLPKDAVVLRNHAMHQAAGITACEALWAVRRANDAALRAAPALPEAPAFSARSAAARALIAAQAAGGPRGGGPRGSASAPAAGAPAPPPAAAAAAAAAEGSCLKVVRNECETRCGGGRLSFDAAGLGLFAPFLPERARGGALRGNELAEALRAAGTGNGGSKLCEFSATFYVQTPGWDRHVAAVPAAVSVSRDRERILFRFGRGWVEILQAASGTRRGGDFRELLGTILLFERFGGGSGGGSGGGRSGSGGSGGGQGDGGASPPPPPPLLLVTNVGRVRLPSRQEAIEMWKRGELQGAGGGSRSRSQSAGPGDGGSGGGAEERKLAPEAENESGDDGMQSDDGGSNSRRRRRRRSSSSSGSSGSGDMGDSSNGDSSNGDSSGDSSSSSGDDDEEVGEEEEARPRKARRSKASSPAPPAAFSRSRVRSSRVLSVIGRSRTGSGRAPSASVLKTLRKGGRFLLQVHFFTQRDAVRLFARLLPPECCPRGNVGAKPDGEEAAEEQPCLEGAELRRVLEIEGRKPGGGRRERDGKGGAGWLWSKPFDVVVDAAPPATASDVACRICLLENRLGRNLFKLVGAGELLEAAGAMRRGSRVLFERYDDAGGEGGGAASSTFVFSNLGVAAAAAASRPSPLASDSEEEPEEGGGGGGGGSGTPEVELFEARTRREKRLLQGEGAAAAAGAVAAATTPADTERPKKPKPSAPPPPPPPPRFYDSGGGGCSGRATVAAATAPAAPAAAAAPPPSLALVLPPTSVSVPLFTGLDCEFLQLSDEAARLFDAAADGALGGDPERASLFAFKQLVVVEVAEAAPAPAGAAAAPSEAPAARSVEIEVDVDRVPNADRVPDAFLTLGGAGWARVVGLLGLAPGAAVRFERDPETGCVRASRAARWF